jgi:hypothetical protein
LRPEAKPGSGYGFFALNVRTVLAALAAFCFTFASV